MKIKIIFNGEKKKIDVPIYGILKLWFVGFLIYTLILLGISGLFYILFELIGGNL